MWTAASCCGCGDDLTQVELYGDGTTVGLSGLRRTFTELYAVGMRPNDTVGAELLARIRRSNYVPRSAEEAYRATLLREYSAFCEAQEQASL